MERKYILQDSPEALQRRLDRKWKDELTFSVIMFVVFIITLTMLWHLSDGNIFVGNWLFATGLCIGFLGISLVSFFDGLRLMDKTPNVDRAIGSKRRLEQENELAMKEIELRKRELELKEKELSAREFVLRANPNNREK